MDSFGGMYRVTPWCPPLPQTQYNPFYFCVLDYLPSYKKFQTDHVACLKLKFHFFINIAIHDNRIIMLYHILVHALQIVRSLSRIIIMKITVVWVNCVWGASRVFQNSCDGMWFDLLILLVISCVWRQIVYIDGCGAIWSFSQSGGATSTAVWCIGVRVNTTMKMVKLMLDFKHTWKSWDRFGFFPANAWTAIHKQN